MFKCCWILSDVQVPLKYDRNSYWQQLQKTFSLHIFLTWRVFTFILVLHFLAILRSCLFCIYILLSCLPLKWHISWLKYIRHLLFRRLTDQRIDKSKTNVFLECPCSCVIFLFKHFFFRKKFLKEKCCSSLQANNCITIGTRKIYYTKINMLDDHLKVLCTFFL